MYILAPSVLGADFTKLGEQIKRADQAGAEYIHLDVMDGEFVPSISFGMPVIKALRGITKKIFDVHLMIEQPERYIEEFAACGADVITVHVESCKHLDRVIHQIKETGAKVGVALNPATPIETIIHVLDLVDMILIMSVNPGFGGQSYIDYSTEKIRSLRNLLNERGLKTDIQVDGGITSDNVNVVLDAGANIIVSGTGVFKGNLEENITRFHEIFKCYN
ncbi:ribulose-phosphate 3-epimerase [Anaerosacchariphilus polymeriproducens]|uniref:Ribulose-phosphate 3-epimerase n=1 Tax=Anaerosacchariphilus polymeriproducens TaxID=1812858 RepID=A0A371AXN4_9FIRM|nr:ribulose-phosphate 3-epimerase [Anaerosacchariphilus polymeriproducens]RDU24317.1 ribulose-phosphate 3-epimerase [Anaerosacchariphilus polymeriproducens]